MRAGPAAMAVIFLMALLSAALPANAECGPIETSPEVTASTADRSPAYAKRLPSLPASVSQAGAIGLPLVGPFAGVSAATAAQAALGGALPGIIAPRAYQPYQPSPFPPRALTAETVAPHLEARGFSAVSAVRQRGQSFLAEATGPRGERVRLVLDASSGEISGMQVIGFERRR